MVKELVCIVCPIGCRITIEEDKNIGGGYKIKGNNCKRGKDYAIKEITNPTRVITSTVKMIDNKVKRLPVKTNGGIPKRLIFSCMEEINKIEVKPPIKVGDVIISNIFGTGVDVVASKTVN